MRTEPLAGTDASKNILSGEAVTWAAEFLCCSYCNPLQVRAVSLAQFDLKSGEHYYALKFSVCHNCCVMK